MPGLLTYIAGGALQGLGQGISNEAQRRWQDVLRRAEEQREERLMKAKVEYETEQDIAKEGRRFASDVLLEGMKGKTAKEVARIRAAGRDGGEDGGGKGGMSAGEKREWDIAVERETEETTEPGTITTIEVTNWDKVAARLEKAGLSRLAALAREESTGAAQPSGGVPSAEAPPREKPPIRAILELRANPKLRDAFDAKYGKGEAAKVLGK